MTDETRQVEVTASVGRYIRGYGSRPIGGVFTLPEKLARELVREQPDAFKMLRTKKKIESVEEVENAD